MSPAFLYSGVSETPYFMKNKINYGVLRPYFILSVIERYG